MPYHTTMVAEITIRSPTAVEAMDGKDRDMDRDIRVVIAHQVMVLRDDVDSVPMGFISVSSRVIAR